MRTAQLLFLFGIALPILAGDESCPTAFTYDSLHGPCVLGKQQSPIQTLPLDRQHDRTLPVLKFAEAVLQPVTVKRTNTEVKVLPMFNGMFGFGDKSARLVQFHFHFPMEHALPEWEGAQMELHLVHESSDGHLYVVAVPIRRGAPPNTAISAIVSLLPSAICQSATSRTEAQLITLAHLLPQDGSSRYMTYEGSLTTPPCAEKVTWFLLNNGIVISDADLEKFKTILGNNARVTQQLHGRQVRYRNP